MGKTSLCVAVVAWMKPSAAIALLAISACGQKDDKASMKSGPSACDAMDTSAAEARALRELVSAQLASVDRAMGKFEQWNRKLVTPDQDSEGEYSGAGHRAFAFKRTALGVCQAALMVDTGLLDFAREWADPTDVASADDVLPRLTCQFKTLPDGAPADRRAVATEWSSLSADARDFEDRLMHACRNKNTGKRREYRVPPIFSLPDE